MAFVHKIVGGFRPFVTLTRPWRRTPRSRRTSHLPVSVKTSRSQARLSPFRERAWFENPTDAGKIMPRPSLDDDGQGAAQSYLVRLPASAGDRARGATLETACRLRRR
jgi:hypothetical protein